MPNDNPDWAKLDVGRIATIRGASLGQAQSTDQNFDSTFTDPLLWTLQYNVNGFNISTAGCTIGIVGSPSETFVKLADVVTPAAANLLFYLSQSITWSSAIDLTFLLSGDTSYQLQVRTGPTGNNTAWAVTLYAGPQL